ncbi:MAG: hypothetical protein N2171_03855 [Clostridia bacterium]|nr:hypothetical protein [Clostridia bacterium]
MVNNASTDLKAEKKELTDINKQITNGMNAILKGMDFPELEEEIIRLRVRKSELEDIIARNNSDNKKVDKNKIVELFKHSMKTWNTDLKSVIKCHITKIYANTDGSYSTNVGVHLNGCGGRI